MRRVPFGWAAAFCAAAVSAVPGPARAQATRTDTLFSESFDRGLAGWLVGGTGGLQAVSIHETGTAHGRVLRMQANGNVHALIRGSAGWPRVAIEGDVQFPAPGDSYLGVMYNARERNGRWDFGLIYLKQGRRVYLQANPHRDYNVTRTFYPEFEANVPAATAPAPGQWARFRVEVVDGIAHYYVGDMAVPVMTFPIAEPGPGAVGFQPRSVGQEVWLDNVVVRRIAKFSYQGPDRPVAVSSDSRWRSNSWEVYGPLTSTRDEVANGTTRARGGRSRSTHVVPWSLAASSIFTARRRSHIFECSGIPASPAQLLFICHRLMISPSGSTASFSDSSGAPVLHGSMPGRILRTPTTLFA